MAATWNIQIDHFILLFTNTFGFPPFVFLIIYVFTSRYMINHSRRMAIESPDKENIGRETRSRRVRNTRNAGKVYSTRSTTKGKAKVKQMSEEQRKAVKEMSKTLKSRLAQNRAAITKLKSLLKQLNEREEDPEKVLEPIRNIPNIQAITQMRLVDFIQLQLNETDSSSGQLKTPAASTTVNIKEENPTPNTFVHPEQGPENGALPIQGTVLRPPTQVPRNGVMYVTPAGKPVRLPYAITPKVGPMGLQTAARRARADEIAFSIDGSPIVVGDNDPSVSVPQTPAANFINEFLTAPDAELTPDTRQIVQNLRNLMAKKTQMAHNADVD